MHELAITQSMVDLVLEEAGKAGTSKIQKINLVIGEMSGYVEECVQSYFDLFAKDTIAEGAKLFCTMVPTQARCRDCGGTFSPKELDWTCPHCQGNRMEIVAGNELRVESIEVD